MGQEIRRSRRRTLGMAAAVMAGLAGCVTGGPGGGQEAADGDGANANASDTNGSDPAANATGGDATGGNATTGDVSGSASTAECGEGDQIQVTEHDYEIVDGTPTVTGTVANNTDTNLTSVRAIVRLVGPGGDVIDRTTVTQNGFAAGQSWSFEAAFPSVDPGRVAGYEVAVRCSGI